MAKICNWQVKILTVMVSQLPLITDLTVPTLQLMAKIIQIWGISVKKKLQYTIYCNLHCIIYKITHENCRCQFCNTNTTCLLSLHYKRQIQVIQKWIQLNIILRQLIYRQHVRSRYKATISTVSTSDQWTSHKKCPYTNWQSTTGHVTHFLVIVKTQLHLIHRHSVLSNYSIHSLLATTAKLVAINMSWSQILTINK